MTTLKGVHVKFNCLADKFNLVAGIQFLQKWGIDANTQRVIKILIWQT